MSELIDNSRRVIPYFLLVILVTSQAQAAPLPLQAISTSHPRDAFSTSDGLPNSEYQIVQAAEASNPSRSAGAKSSNAAPPQTRDQSNQSTTPRPAANQQSDTTQLPVGVAAAPSENTIGVAASRPAGAVIAPAKQRRARSFFIRVGVVVGVCVAVGTVMALSHSSPSQPQ